MSPSEKRQAYQELSSEWAVEQIEIIISVSKYHAILSPNVKILILMHALSVYGREIKQKGHITPATKSFKPWNITISEEL